MHNFRGNSFSNFCLFIILLSILSSLSSAVSKVFFQASRKHQIIWLISAKFWPVCFKRVWEFTFVSDNEANHSFWNIPIIYFVSRDIFNFHSITIYYMGAKFLSAPQIITLEFPPNMVILCIIILNNRI